MELSNSTLFIVTSVAVILMPGPAMIFVISNGLTKGPKASIAAAIGTTAGVSTHLLCAVFGLAVILKTSIVLFTILKYAGAAYLIYMAIKTLLNKDEIIENIEEEKLRSIEICRQGFLINILNPKLSIFFLAFLPQFIIPSSISTEFQTLLLGIIFMLMTVVIFIGYGIFSSSIRNKVLGNKKIQKYIKWCFASVFLGLGLKLAFTEKQ
jgi:threonine/homoserine/homoserine lactone efflux protein